VDGAGHQFLAGAGFAEDHHRAGAAGDGGQHLEHALHQGTAAGQVANPEFAAEFLAQRFDLGKVAKGFGAADDPPSASRRTAVEMLIGMRSPSASMM
jgi:hypothetical protein